MTDQIKEYLKTQRWFRPFRLANFAARVRFGGHPNWTKLLRDEREAWIEARRRADGGPRVLVATSVGAHLAVSTFDSLLCVALTLRGAEVHVLLCDSTLPACMACEVNWYPDQQKFVRNGPSKDLCRHCFPPAHQMFAALGVKLHSYSELLTPEERDEAERLASAVPFKEIGSLTEDGVPIGEHAMAGALRFFARGDMGSEPNAEPVLRRYLSAALMTARLARRLFETHDYSSAVIHHGIYVPQGLLSAVANRQSVSVATWNAAYRNGCFIFSRGDTYHHTLMSEPVEHWQDLQWSPQMEERTLAYLKSRWTGSEDWIWFHEKPRFDLPAIEKELGMDLEIPTVGLLTNVMWDAQLHYPTNAFPNMREWLLRTIDYFAGRPDLQLVIRVHPAEVNGQPRSRQPVVDEIPAASDLPGNVFVIPPESRISTYAVMSRCDAAIIYGTKTGIELASQGIPVIVAGEAWVRNKGFTLDASSPEEYFALLDRLPLGKRLSESQIERARRYAFHFFFRRMIPIEAVAPSNGWPPYRIEQFKLDDLRPGRSPGLDVVCDGILSNREFVFPAPFMGSEKQSDIRSD